MTLTEYANLKKGDRVKALFDGKGTVISTFGIGVVVEWDKGTVSRVQNNGLELIEKKSAGSE